MRNVESIVASASEDIGDYSFSERRVFIGVTHLCRRLFFVIGENMCSAMDPCIPLLLI